MMKNAHYRIFSESSVTQKDMKIMGTAAIAMVAATAAPLDQLVQEPTRCLAVDQVTSMQAALEDAYVSGDCSAMYTQAQPYTAIDYLYTAPACHSLLHTDRAAAASYIDGLACSWLDAPMLAYTPLSSFAQHRRYQQAEPFRSTSCADNELKTFTATCITNPFSAYPAGIGLVLVWIMTVAVAMVGALGLTLRRLWEDAIETPTSDDVQFIEVEVAKKLDFEPAAPMQNQAQTNAPAVVEANDDDPESFHSIPDETVIEHEDTFLAETHLFEDTAEIAYLEEHLIPAPMLAAAPTPTAAASERAETREWEVAAPAAAPASPSTPDQPARKKSFKSRVARLVSPLKSLSPRKKRGSPSPASKWRRVMAAVTSRKSKRMEQASPLRQ